MDAPDTRSLPPNAYTALAPGESYRPVVPAEAAMPEATLRSVLWGLLLCVVFTVASAYSGLKVGQVMEAAIPISILTIGLARVFRRRSTLLELFEALRSRLGARHPRIAELRPVHGPFRTGDVLHSLADIAKARRLLGYEPTHTLDQGLDEALGWYEKSLS